MLNSLLEDRDKRSLDTPVKSLATVDSGGNVGRSQAVGNARWFQVHQCVWLVNQSEGSVDSSQGEGSWLSA
jgi:hypothetical protein